MFRRFGSSDRLFFKLRNNVDWAQPFAASDYDPNTNTRAPHDLTGAQLRMQVFAGTTGSDDDDIVPTGAAVLDVSTVNGDIVISSNATTGEFFLLVAADQMFAVPPGNYIGDMLIFGPDGSTKLAFTARIDIDAGDTVPTA